jgi:cysteinyl-tRNA synthetase
MSGQGHEHESILDRYVSSAREIADFLKPQRPQVAQQVKETVNEVVQAVEDLMTAEY